MQKGSKITKEVSDSSTAVAAEANDDWKMRKGPKLQGDTHILTKDYQQMYQLLAGPLQ